MYLKILKLTLVNFKCFSHKEITFNDDITVIRGKHGEGKTTIADAIPYLFFGKNSFGQTNFSIKTKDEDGNDIPHLDHSVEIDLLVSRDGHEKVYNLKRVLKEVWIKKHGTTKQVLKNNTTEYYVDGCLMTAKDYEKFISELVSEEIFRSITDPLYFPSLKWQVQREFLLKLVGGVSTDDIAGKDNDLIEFAEQQLGEDKDIIAYRKHISYQMKKVKDKLSDIPVRREEQNKSLPEKLDWDGIFSEAANTKVAIGNIEDEILAIKSGNGGDMEKERIRTEIRVVRQDIDKITEQVRKQVNDVHKVQGDKVSELTRRFNQLVTTQRDLEASIKSYETLADRCRKTADEQFKSEQTYIREHWADTQADFRQSDSTTCPVCHQTLPQDMMEKAEETFNLRKAELKQKLTDRAEKAKKLLADAEAQIEEYKAKKSEAEKHLEETKQEINTVFAEKAKLEKEPLPTLEDELMNSDDYTSLLQKESELKIKLEEAGTSEDNGKRLAELDDERKKLSQHLDQLNSQLASKSQYEKVMGNIAAIEEDERNLQEQLSELEQKDDLSRRYQDRQNGILEERINQHFSTVKWKMFRTVNNGGEPFDEPYCECYVGGIAYHDGLNQAHRLNAGLDIINFLCRHYNVSAPIVIDQAESVLEYTETTGQQIRLQVAPVELQVL